MLGGTWASWSPWSACSVTCGRGLSIRKRTCDDTSATRFGRACPGSPDDWRLCDLPACKGANIILCSKDHNNY